MSVKCIPGKGRNLDPTVTKAIYVRWDFSYIIVITTKKMC